MTDSIMRPSSSSSNLGMSQSTLGQELRKLVRVYDRQIEKHVEQVASIHQTILEIGRRLRTGRDLHRSNKEFGLWCQRYSLDQGAFRDQQERTAAMLIAELHDDGVAPLGLEENPDGTDVSETDRIKLDLTGCRRTGPTNILSWARKHQPGLFPALAVKREARRRAQALKQTSDDERSNPVDDDVLIAHDVNRTSADEEAIAALRARVAELEAQMAELEAENADLRSRLMETSESLAPVPSGILQVPTDIEASVREQENKRAKAKAARKAAKTKATNGGADWTELGNALTKAINLGR